ncbi:MAG: tRNA (N6-threonylcarbamoyladenosine(37)-N6)-methyltransferase TrmO [Candidatus Bathyarchaeia archaeon]|jgi:tRNA-Thr(GGU) m(6)t(6)A37 methyltransferase TsaA
MTKEDEHTHRTNKDVTFRPVGVVRTQASDDEIRERSRGVATIEIFPEFQEALDGLDGFSHIFVLSYLDRLKPEQIGVLKVRPRRLVRKGFKLEELPLVGVFAVDSPTRPNPIALSLVRLLHIQGRELTVYGLDCFDGTPVLDIKPYRDNYRADQYRLAEWYKDLREKAGEDI